MKYTVELSYLVDTVRVRLTSIRTPKQLIKKHIFLNLQ